MIVIVGWLGPERRAEREGNGKRSHRAHAPFIALGSASRRASVARIVPVGSLYRCLGATIVRRGSTAANFFQQATLADEELTA
jgi:hypothetical protein